MSRPALRTERLILRPLAREDAGAMYDALCDAQVMAYWDWPGAQSLEDAEGFVGAHCDEVARGSAHFRSICRDGAVIGTCDLREVDDHRKRAEVGFMLIRRHWRQGYAREAMGAVIPYAFEVLGLARLSARIHAGNAGSARLLTGLGFRREGRLSGFVLRAGKRRDCEMYGMVRA